MKTHVVLRRAERRLRSRLEALETRLQSGDEAAWPEFLEVAKTLAAILPTLRPEAGAPMLTTAAMAEQLGVSTKTLLRHKGKGRIQPMMQRGKLVRWSGQERLQ